ncbi:unnamed protein product, partial [Mesorhabditis spiculigera]
MEERRAVRPNFAEDVYGSGAGERSAAVVAEMSESSLAQRRSAVLPKLNNLKNDDGPSKNEKENEMPAELGDLGFSYADADDYENELAELYSYSEMEDFASNAVAYRTFLENTEGLNVLSSLSFCDLGRQKQINLLTALMAQMESAVPEERFLALRAVLYVLQGAYMDFDDDDGEQVNNTTSNPAPLNEKECLMQAARNSYLAAETGLFGPLVSMLLFELEVPYEPVGCNDGRESKASFSSNHRASTSDLSESGKKKRSANLADNESLRAILAGLYHLVETIRREELVDVISETAETRAYLRRVRINFLDELDHPIPSSDRSLLIIMCDMMTPFYNGTSPHIPVKKAFLLTWKILLATFGDSAFLHKKKSEVRAKHGLYATEDTLEIAHFMRTCVINDGDTGFNGGSRPRRSVPGRLGRQMAYTGLEGDESAESDILGLSSTTPIEDETPSPALSERTGGLPKDDSGERTPIASSPVHIPMRRLPWRSKARKEDIDCFLQTARNKYLRYELAGDLETHVGLPAHIVRGLKVLQDHLYTSISDIQLEREDVYHRYKLTVKEEVELSKVEMFYRALLPNMVNYVVALLKVLLAAAPNSKVLQAKNEAVNIMCDVLTPETDTADVLSSSMSLDRSGTNPLEESVRLAIDIHRHKEIIVKAASGIIILMLKHFRLNHVYQFEAFAQQLIYGNGIPLMLRFLDQNMIRYVQSRHELRPYNYPYCALYWARNSETFPTLGVDNIEAEVPAHGYFLWRNIFSAVNMVRILNKLTKGKHARNMMLVVFKSAPILKRCLKIRVPILQLYTLKLLKMQARFLGRQWRRTNMDIISAIYCSVRHRLIDDWAFANDSRSKSWDFQADEQSLKVLIERFNSRRYSKLYPAFAVEQGEDQAYGDDYLDRWDPLEYVANDYCIHSVLAAEKFEPESSWMDNYEAWLEKEVFSGPIDWDQLLLSSN